jgi:hypothetical protein
MSILNNKAKSIILSMIVATMPKIKVHPGVLRYNFRCHQNCVHDAINDSEDKIAMCFYIDNSHPIIHFLNYDDGKYIDNTLGHWSSKYDFFFVRFIEKESFWDIGEIFDNYRKELRRKLPFLVRLFSNVQF